MVLAQRLEQRQAQGLVMTPQMQQAVALLQFSNLDLAGHLAEQAATNPFLEIEAPEGFAPIPISGGIPSASKADFDLAATLADHPTLARHLEWQITIDIKTEPDREIARLFLAHLNERGYLDPAWTEDFGERGIAQERALGILGQLQQMDPPGIFARDLAECLRLQLMDAGALTPALDTLLHHWQDLAAGNHRALEAAGITRQRLPGLLALMKPLHPRPAEAFGEPGSGIIEPDIIMREMRGGWRVDLNPNTLPRLIVNRDYHTAIVSGAKNSAEKTWMTEKLASASWLARALDQRARTLLSVSEKIIEAQAGFFKAGSRALKPLTLRMIAEAAGVHESTVSRVTSNKTMGTPRGIFDLKYFFPVGMPSSSDSENGCSATAIRDDIRQLVAAEKADAILSDDDLVEILAGRGMKAARRTIAKYREAMNIPSSYARKRLRRLSG